MSPTLGDGWSNKLKVGWTEGEGIQATRGGVALAGRQSTPARTGVLQITASGQLLRPCEVHPVLLALRRCRVLLATVADLQSPALELRDPP